MKHKVKFNIVLSLMIIASLSGAAFTNLNASEIESQDTTSEIQSNISEVKASEVKDQQSESVGSETTSQESSEENSEQANNVVNTETSTQAAMDETSVKGAVCPEADIALDYDKCEMSAIDSVNGKYLNTY